MKHCPICWRRVEPTIRGNIYGHTDKTGRSPCPGSFEPYEIALAATQSERGQALD